MDKDSLRVLEFGKVLLLAAKHAVTAPGREAVLSLTPITDAGVIRSRIDLVSEFREMFSLGISPGIEHFDDLGGIFRKVAPPEAVLEPLELRALLPLFRSVERVREAVAAPSRGGTPSFPNLKNLITGLHDHRKKRDDIERAIDREGHITDNASFELHDIRQRKRSLYNRIKKRLEDILRRRELLPHLQDFYITERNGRWVVPLKRDSKGRIPGVIHDISNTGETLFVEPFEIQTLGNELEALKAEERLEELRVLRGLSTMVRESLNEIREDYNLIVKLDSFQAVASFADDLKMSPPEITTERFIRIISGRHPVLFEALRKRGKQEDHVPLDIEIGKDYQVMVITGSNTGGKTVALKTVGVIVMMALTGMHVPAGSGTIIPILDEVLADIGDEQSIEESLSTFSAHILRIREILERSSSRALVIMDELGTGTDPEEGAALSSAILKHLRERGALTIVSTHLGFLKSFAHIEKGMINGAMEMEKVSTGDAVFFRPTYRLVIGVPGRSNAFEIARQFGIPEEIIEEAKRIGGESGKRIEETIRALEEERQRLKAFREKADQLRARLRDEIEELKKRRSREIEEARKEAREILRKTRAEAKKLLREMKKAGPKEASAIIKEIDRRISGIPQKTEPLPSRPIPKEELAEGTLVQIASTGIIGRIKEINLKTGRCRLTAEGRELEISVEGLIRPEKEALRKDEERGEREGISLRREEEAFSPELNIIGRRVDDALPLIERFINDASLSGIPSVRIIHGRGTGRLSSAVRDYLSGHPLVSGLRPGTDEEGGEAVTIVEF